MSQSYATYLEAVVRGWNEIQSDPRMRTRKPGPKETLLGLLRNGQFDMNCSGGCALGSLYGNYETGFSCLSIKEDDAAAYGFNLDDRTLGSEMTTYRRAYDDLAEAWFHVLNDDERVLRAWFPGDAGFVVYLLDDPGETRSRMDGSGRTWARVTVNYLGEQCHALSMGIPASDVVDSDASLAAAIRWVMTDAEEIRARSIGQYSLAWGEDFCQLLENLAYDPTQEPNLVED